MKKDTLLYIFTALAICGCNHQNNTNEQSSNTNQTPASTKQSPKKNIIHKIIPIGAEFTHLLCVSGANIVYTQGEYKMEAIGDSSALQYLETDFDSNTLTISIGAERYQDLNIYEGKLDVTINLSAPNLQCVSLCSSGDFTSKGVWETDKIEFGIIGKGDFHCDSIKCNIFDLQSTGEGNAYFSHIDSKSTHFANMSYSNINADLQTDLLMCENKGNSTITFTGQARTQQLFPTKSGKILFEKK